MGEKWLTGLAFTARTVIWVVGLVLWVGGSYGSASGAVAPAADAERSVCQTGAAEMEARFDIPPQLLVARALDELERWNA
jgi:hypothetical protein